VRQQVANRDASPTGRSGIKVTTGRIIEAQLPLLGKLKNGGRRKNLVERVQPETSACGYGYPVLHVCQTVRGRFYDLPILYYHELQAGDALPVHFTANVAVDDVGGGWYHPARRREKGSQQYQVSHARFLRIQRRECL